MGEVSVEQVRIGDSEEVGRIEPSRVLQNALRLE
jgi:hypothetical protein